MTFCFVSFTWMNIWHSLLSYTKNFTSVLLKCKYLQQPDILTRIFCSSGKINLDLKDFITPYGASWCSEITMTNQIFLGRGGSDFVLCSAFLCLSILRTGIFAHFWQYLCFPSHALVFIRCIWLQHNATFTLRPTMTEYNGFLYSLPGVQRYLLYVCVLRYRGLGCREGGI